MVAITWSCTVVLRSVSSCQIMAEVLGWTNKVETRILSSSSRWACSSKKGTAPDNSKMESGHPTNPAAPSYFESWTLPSGPSGRCSFYTRGGPTFAPSGGICCQQLWTAVLCCAPALTNTAWCAVCTGPIVQVQCGCPAAFFWAVFHVSTAQCDCT